MTKTRLFFALLSRCYWRRGCATPGFCGKATASPGGGRPLLHGKVLYRDIWYDKPPLRARVSPAGGRGPGWPLRLAGALYAFLLLLDRVRVRARFVVAAEGCGRPRRAGDLPDLYIPSP